jgi:hypothetical protein
MKLVGVGSPNVDFQEPGQKSAGEVAFRRLLQDRIGEALKKSGQEQPVIELPPNLIPEELIERMEDPTLARALQLADFQTGNGWLTIGYNLDPSARLPQPNTATTQVQQSTATAPPIVQKSELTSSRR